jgi:FkbM family methyltransferase
MNKNLIKLTILLLTSTTAYLHAITRISVDPKEVLTFVKQFLPPNPIIVEAGAYDGADTKLMAQLWPKGIIHSFEPVQENFEKLKTVVQRQKNVYCYPLALSNQNGVATFYVSEFTSQPGIPSASGSLFAPAEHLVHYNQVAFPRQVQVTTTTLDHWAKQYQIPKVDFFWLDMQGHELTALKSGLTLLKKAKLVYMEVELVKLYKDQPLYTEVKKWMEDNGFELIALDFDESCCVGCPGWRIDGNALFKNKFPQ